MQDTVNKIVEEEKNLNDQIDALVEKILSALSAKGVSLR